MVRLGPKGKHILSPLTVAKDRSLVTSMFKRIALQAGTPSDVIDATRKIGAGNTAQCCLLALASAIAASIRLHSKASQTKMSHLIIAGVTPVEVLLHE